MKFYIGKLYTSNGLLQNNRSSQCKVKYSKWHAYLIISRSTDVWVNLLISDRHERDKSIMNQLNKETGK